MNKKIICFICIISLCSCNPNDSSNFNSNTYSEGNIVNTNSDSSLVTSTQSIFTSNSTILSDITIENTDTNHSTGGLIEDGANTDSGWGDLIG